jgi:hypothetical protein
VRRALHSALLTRSRSTARSAQSGTRPWRRQAAGLGVAYMFVTIVLPALVGLALFGWPEVTQARYGLSAPFHTLGRLSVR